MSIVLRYWVVCDTCWNWYCAIFMLCEFLIKHYFEVLFHIVMMMQNKFNKVLFRFLEVWSTFIWSMCGIPNLNRKGCYRNSRPSTVHSGGIVSRLGIEPNADQAGFSMRKSISDNVICMGILTISISSKKQKVWHCHQRSQCISATRANSKAS